MNSLAIVVLAIVGLAAAGHHGGGGGGGGGHAHYKFEYGVHDPHTHDFKSQHEHRDGDHATGGYTLKEADGTHRVVKYSSGPHKGFEAVVERQGHAHHPHHGTSYVGVTHWANQGPAEHGHGGHGY